MSTNRVLILHGWGGSDYPHWQAQLASSLACDYGTVSFPLLDNPHFPTKNRWLEQTKQILTEFKPNTIVCHSLACILWFWLANENEYKIDHLILVSPPSLDTKIETVKSFFPCPLPCSLNALKINFIVSDNDPYMKIDEAQNLANKYNINLEILHDAGHINSDSGFGRWEYMEKLLGRKK